LKLERVNVKFVPRQMTTDRMMVGGDLFEKSTQDPMFLKKIVTGDETLVFTYYPERKMHASEQHIASSLRPKKSVFIITKENVMPITFFDIDGLVKYFF
jgi:hypothetical protein